MRFDYGYSEENQLGRPYDFKLLKRLVPFFAPYRRLLLGSVALVVVLTLFELAMPYFSKIVIDRYIVPPAGHSQQHVAKKIPPENRFLTVDTRDPAIAAVVARHPQLFSGTGPQRRITYKNLEKLNRSELLALRHADISGLLQVVMLFLAVVILNFAFTFAQRVIMEYTGHKVMHDLRLRLYDHIQQQSLAFLADQPVARLVTRVTNDVQNMHELFTTFISMVFKDSFLLVGIAAMLLALDWRLTLAGFAVLPLVAWAAMRFATLARDVFRELRIKVAEINARMAETIDGIRTIQTFVQEKTNLDHFRELNQENYRLGMKQIHIFAIFMPVIEALGIVAAAAVIFYGGLHVLSATVSLGVMVAAISYIRMFFRPLRDLSENYNVLQNAMASAERIFLLLDTDRRMPAAAAHDDGGLPDRRKAPVIATVDAHENNADRRSFEKLEFRDVSFAYASGEPVLRDISFTAARGRTIALVGPTGAGKTSILNLILRFYDPDSGQVRVNGLDARRWDHERLRALMALVPQDPMLFSGSLRENIFPADGNADPAAVEAVLAAANLRRLVDNLPGGLDGRLVKGGSGMSSGERQLVAIARALARDPQLILLDEATSYIDSQTEAAVHSALHNLMAGRTAVVVAHRLSTARSADRIIVMHHGRIRESGTHDELLAGRGLYWRLTHNLVQAEGRIQPQPDPTAAS